MTHDFANKSKRRSGNSGKGKQRRKKTTVPAWAWLTTGLITGLFIAFLGYLAGIAPEPPAPATVAKRKPAELPAGKPATQSNGKQGNAQDKTGHPKPRFDFYTLLPESEVIVPDTADPKGGTVPESEAVIYILQVGSFRRL